MPLPIAVFTMKFWLSHSESWCVLDDLIPRSPIIHRITDNVPNTIFINHLLTNQIVRLKFLELPSALTEPCRLDQAAHLALIRMQAFWLIRLTVLSRTWIIPLGDHPRRIACNKLLRWIVLVDSLSLDIRNFGASKGLGASCHKAFIWIHALQFVALPMLGIWGRIWTALPVIYGRTLIHLKFICIFGQFSPFKWILLILLAMAPFLLFIWGQ